jgi:hypothetical protein
LIIDLLFKFYGNLCPDSGPYQEVTRWNSSNAGTGLSSPGPIRLKNPEVKKLFRNAPENEKKESREALHLLVIQGIP